MAMADRLLLLLQAAPVLSPSGSLSSSSSSSTACYKEGGCISDYVAVALTALVSLMIFGGSVLLVLRRTVPEIKAKQVPLLLIQSIGSIVWLTSLLMTRNMFKLSHRNSFWESCYLWQLWLEGPFGFGLLISCHIARAFRLYYVFVGRRLPPIRSTFLVPLLLVLWILLSTALQAVQPFRSINECSAHWYIWVVIGSMHLFYALVLILCTWAIRNIRFEFNEFTELVTGVSICLIFLVLWIIMNIVKQLAAGGGRLLGVFARFVLVFLGNVVVSCLFWIPVTRPLLAHMLHHPVLGAGRSNLNYDHSMGEALGVPNSGLLVPPAAHISLDEPLESLLQHKRFRLSFLSFAESRIAGETVHFWDEVRELSKLSLTQQDRRVYMADHIIQRYIVNGSQCEINISAQMRLEILSTNDLADPNLFKRAAEEAVHMMQTNLLKEYWQSSYFQELKNQIEMDMEYSAQLERMNIRDIPLRVIRNRDYELPTDNPFDRSQASSVPSSGPLDPQGVNLGSRANGNSTSKSLDFKNIPPWESKAHESQSAYENRLSKIRVNMDGSASSQSRHLSNRNRLGYLISQRSPSPPHRITPGLDSCSDNENNNKAKDPNIITRPASR
ncbi:hypothetical protein CY35_19G044800 [Sphagnum magellanicum]|nr:hypothetical protein CY35_19G044800 [Sphagnum magellanicum]KAH9531570.1 hypothetical protein CY35_19G044800 [Sphagnum magellanicum]